MRKIYFTVVIGTILVLPFFVQAQEYCCRCGLEPYPADTIYCYESRNESECQSHEDFLKPRNPEVNCNLAYTSCETQSDLCSEVYTAADIQNSKQQGSNSSGATDIYKEFIPQATIPGSDFIIGESIPVVSFEKSGTGDKVEYIFAELLPRYIRAIYQYGVWVAIVLAIFMIMVGGFLWLISGGSSERVSTAKSFINHALVGLIIALFSYGILATINPRTVNLETLQIDVKESIKVESLCCLIDGDKNKPTYFNKTDDIKNCKDFSPKWVECPQTGEYFGACCVCTTQRTVSDFNSETIHTCFMNPPGRNICPHSQCDFVDRNRGCRGVSEICRQEETIYDYP